MLLQKKKCNVYSQIFFKIILFKLIVSAWKFFNTQSVLLFCFPLGGIISPVSDYQYLRINSVAE